VEDSHEAYVGLDVAMKETAIRIVDDQLRVVREGRAASEPEAIAAFLVATGLAFERVGIEASASLSPGRWPPVEDALEMTGAKQVSDGSRQRKA
jgi:hypothetical protein